MRGALTALALATAALASVACGASVQHAERPPSGFPERDPALVRVTTSPSANGRVVSFSIDERDVREPLPDVPNAGVLAAMRDEAARRGAAELFVERVDTPWRKAFFGIGRVPGDEATTPDVCRHPAYPTGVAEAVDDATRCIAAARKARPALQGEVAVILQLDPDGRVMQAAADPESSKDGEVRACALAAAFEADFGAPPGFTCQGRFAVPFGDAVPGAP